MTQPAVFNRIVVKVGASVLAGGSGAPEAERVSNIASQVAACMADGRQAVLVSSGAIACGMARLGLKRRPAAIAQLQACAAIGQGDLMGRYSRAFDAHRVTVAQVLLTQSDLADAARRRNAKHTLHALLERRIVPIINENDAVAVEEITFGDNDRLAALVGSVLEAQLIVILSDVDGFLHHGEVVGRIDRLDHTHHAMALGASRETTTGGMASKLAAGRIAQHAGIPLVIANGRKPDVLARILAGQPEGTLIAPPSGRLGEKKWWIAFALRAPRGRVAIDAGAAEALLNQGKSLLASGIQAVEGRFDAGDPVAIVDAAGEELGRGVCNFTARELSRVRGMKTAEIRQLLGAKAPSEAIHRDNLVLTRELHA
jgi:glutamate 5-kinase